MLHAQAFKKTTVPWGMTLLSYSKSWMVHRGSDSLVTVKNLTANENHEN